MPRPNIPTDLVASLLDTNSGQGLIPLLHIAWDDGPHSGHLYAVRHDENVTYNGNLYIAAWFTVTLPPEDETIAPLMRVIVGDVTREVRQAIEQLDPRYPATVEVNFHLLSEVPTLTTGPVLPFSGTLRRIKTDPYMLAGDIEIYDDIADEPTTPYRMVPAYGFKAKQQ